MKFPAYTRSMILLLAGLPVAAVAIVFFAPSLQQKSSSETTAPPQEAAADNAPTLTCWFHDFTRAAIVVRFDFDVATSKDAPPNFEQRAQAERDGSEKFFDAGERPQWPYSLDDEGTPMLTSPTGSERIVLYGLDLNASKALFIEAGLRSNSYRNLGGRCRQANLGGAQKNAASASGSSSSATP